MFLCGATVAEILLRWFPTQTCLSVTMGIRLKVCLVAYHLYLFAGSPKHEHSFSPHLREDSARASDHRGRRELERDPGRSQYSRSSSDSHRYSDRQSSRYSRSHNRHDDYNRHDHKYADEEERQHQKLSSRYVRESKGGTYSDQTRQETVYNRSRDKYSHRRNDADKEDSYLEHQKQRDKESSYNRDGSGRRHAKELDGRKRDKEEKNIDDRERIKEKNRHGRETGEQFEGKTVPIGENQGSVAKRPKMFSFVDSTEYGNDGILLFNSCFFIESQ